MILEENIADALAEIALEAAQSAKSLTPASLVRQLAIRALQDAAGHQWVCRDAHVKFGEAMAKHNELNALADRIERGDVIDQETATSLGLAEQCPV